MSKFLWIISVMFFILIAQAAFGDEAGQIGSGGKEAMIALRQSAETQTQDDTSDIQWFKKEMKISPKYLEKNPGVMGMSWAHFLTMVFLVIFFVGALIAVYMRNKRTKTILTSLLKEKDREPES